MKKNLAKLGAAVAALAVSVGIGAGNASAGNWETLIWIDGLPLVTRAANDSAGGEDMFKLRETAQFMGYTVSWNGEAREVTLAKDGDIHVLLADAPKCRWNGEVLELETGIMIEDDYSYLPSSFLEDILGAEVSVERGPERNRIDGVTIYTCGYDAAAVVSGVVTEFYALDLAEAIIIDGETYYISEDTAIYDTHGAAADSGVIEAGATNGCALRFDLDVNGNKWAEIIIVDGYVYY